MCNAKVAQYLLFVSLFLLSKVPISWSILGVFWHVFTSTLFSNHSISQISYMSALNSDQLWSITKHGSSKPLLVLHKRGQIPNIGFVLIHKTIKSIGYWLKHSDGALWKYLMNIIDIMVKTGKRLNRLA